MSKSFVPSDEENPAFMHHGAELSCFFTACCTHPDHGKVSLWGPEKITP